MLIFNQGHADSKMPDSGIGVNFAMSGMDWEAQIICPT